MVAPGMPGRRTLRMAILLPAASAKGGGRTSEQGQLQEPLAGVETGAFAALSVDMLSMATLFSSVLYSSH